MATKKPVRRYGGKGELIERAQVKRFQQLSGIKPSQLLGEQTMADYDTGSWDYEEEEVEYEPAEIEYEEPEDTGTYDTGTYDTGTYDAGDEDLDFPADGQSIDQAGPAQSVVEPYESFTDDACGPGYIDTGEQCIPADDATATDWESGEYVDDDALAALADETPDIDIDTDIDVEDSWKYEAHEFAAGDNIGTSNQLKRAEVLSMLYQGPAGTSGSATVDDFRGWVNDNHPELAQGKKKNGGVELSRRGADNTYARDAYNFEIDTDGDGAPDTALGALYVEDRIGPAQYGDSDLAEEYASMRTELDLIKTASGMEYENGVTFGLSEGHAPAKDPYQIVDLTRLSRETNVAPAILAAFMDKEAGKANSQRFECDDVYTATECEDAGGSGLNAGFSYRPDIMIKFAEESGAWASHSTRKDGREISKARRILERTSFGFGQILGENGAMDAWARSAGYADYDAAEDAYRDNDKTDIDMLKDMLAWQAADPVEAGFQAAKAYWTRSTRGETKAAYAVKNHDFSALGIWYNGAMMPFKQKTFLKAGIVNEVKNDEGKITGYAWNEDMFLPGQVPTSPPSFTKRLLRGHGSNVSGLKAMNDRLTPAGRAAYERNRYDGELRQHYEAHTRAVPKKDYYGMRGGLSTTPISSDDSNRHITVTAPELRRRIVAARADNPDITGAEVLQQIITERSAGFGPAVAATPGHRDDKVYYESKLRGTIQKAINKYMLKEKIRSTVLLERPPVIEDPGGFLDPSLIPGFSKSRQFYDKRMAQKDADRRRDARAARVKSDAPVDDAYAQSDIEDYEIDPSIESDASVNDAYAQSDSQDYEIDPSIESDALGGDAIADASVTRTTRGGDVGDYRFLTRNVVREAIKIKVSRPWSEEPCELPTLQEASPDIQEAYTQNVYEIECSIRIDKKKGGDKEQTLTDIRGIPGVTIVGVVPGSSKESPNYFISTLLLKFEQNNNIPPRNYIKKTLTPGLRKIPGVGSFKVKRIKHLSRAKN
jgi:hypothetical protein